MTTPPHHSALNAGVVAAIDDLDLAARVIVEGLRTGGHRSPFHGYTTEFRQYRPYRAGDELKHVDWKLFGRSDRLFTRQFRETTNLSVMLVLDTSPSMAYPAGNAGKFRHAQVLAAALAYLVSQSGNAIGLMSMHEGRLSYVPARGGRPHLRSLVAQIDRLAPGPGWEGPRVISRGAQLLQRRGVVLVLSDFYDDEDATLRELRHVAQHGHDVGMLQVLSPAELSLPWRGQVEIEDLESGERRLADATAIAEHYAAEVQRFLARCRAGATSGGLEYALFSTDVPLETSLRDYLRLRALRATPGRAR